MAVGAIDIGTNSVRLLVTDEQGRELDRRMQITRLGEGVDVHGTLQPTALARTLKVLEEYRRPLTEYGAHRVRITATSAARDAANRDLFFSEVERVTGHRPELLSGEAEAALSFAGATADLPRELAPFLVIDIGGGSTEFVLGTKDPEHLLSVDMGCVRMTERFLLSDPPSGEEVRACCAEIQRLLSTVMHAIPVARAKTVLGLAGSVTTLASLHAGLTQYDPKLTHGMSLERHQVERLADRLLSAPVDARRKLLLEPKRAEVIAGGVLILQELLRTLDIEVLRVSESDILDGLAASLRKAPRDAKAP